MEEGQEKSPVQSCKAIVDDQGRSSDSASDRYGVHCMASTVGTYNR